MINYGIRMYVKKSQGGIVIRGLKMGIVSAAKIIQIRFDEEYIGTVELTIPDSGLARMFHFKFLHPGSDNEALRVHHNNTPFIVIQASGPNEDFGRLLEALPKARKSVLPFIIRPVLEGYEYIRAESINPNTEAGQSLMLSLLGIKTAPVTFPFRMGFRLTSTEEFRIVCEELKALPPYRYDPRMN